MHRAIGYTIDTKDLKLMIEQDKNKRGELIGYTDSNYASNKDTRKSVSGCAIYFMNTFVFWKSKTQHCVTMSSTEAEYVAMSLCVMEMEFVRQVIESTGFEIILPMKLYVDNMGAIDLVTNYSTTGRTKHIDVHYHFLREMIEQGMLELLFVPADDIVSDIFTKNLPNENFFKHTKTMKVVPNGESVGGSFGHDNDDDDNDEEGRTDGEVIYR